MATSEDASACVCARPSEPQDCQIRLVATMSLILPKTEEIQFKSIPAPGL